MTIRRVPVDVFREELICDSCKIGECVYNGTAFYSSPLQFEHVCNNCGVKPLLLKKFPRTIYVPKVSEEQGNG